MISKTPEQRRYYDARMKWERDEATRVALMEKAKAEMEKAQAEAENAVANGKVGQIHLLQGLLGESTSSAEALRAIPLGDLDEMIEGLQTKVRNRLK